jgi:hypothetical protein
MGIEAKTNNYWIAPNAISISLNALGDENRIQGSVTSGSVISCYIESVKPESAGEAYAGNGDGLGLDNGRNPKRWLLTISPTYFNSDTPKYVYVAIPRRASFGTQAIVVFPSEQIDIYGKNENDEQIGSVDYFYIWLRGIISAPVERDSTLQREWTQGIVWGSLGTYEDIMDMSESEWYTYTNADGGTVTFLKKIIMKAGSFFQNIFLGDQDHELTGVATSDITYTDSDTLVATPGYVESQYLSKTHESEAQEKVGFLKGLWVGVRNLYEITANGIAKLKSVIAEDVNAQRVQTGDIKSPNYTGDGVADTGFRLTNSHNGHSKLTIDELYVRMKAVFESLEVRERTYTGGDQIWSCAGNRIIRVDYLGNVETADHVPQMINVHADGRPEGQGQGDVYSVPVPGDTYGYSDVKVPWLLRQMPLLARSKVFARYRKVRIVINEPTGNSANRAAASESPLANIRRARCYFLAKDDDTEVHNWWRINDLARCQTMNLANTTRKTYLSGEDEKAGNIFWWRKVIGVSYEPVTLDDGKQYHYFDVSFDYEYEQSHPEVMATLVMEGSDIPAAQDAVVQFGNTIIEGRMNLMMMEVNGSDAVGYNPTTDAPCLKAYRGIYCFNLNKSWVGGNTCKMKLSPNSGYEFYGPNFKQVTEYDVVPVPVERGLWTDITPTRDDYREHAMVRKCYYYDKVSHNGSYWLCSIVDGAHWVNGDDNYISDADYAALSDAAKSLCSRKQNYTIEEPSANSIDWTLMVARGTMGETPAMLFKEVVHGTTPAAPDSAIYTADRYMAADDDSSDDSSDSSDDNWNWTWSKTAPNRREGYDIWMSQNTILTTDANTYLLKNQLWSTPTRISGDKGEPGEDAADREWIYIGKQIYHSTYDDGTPEWEHPKDITRGKVHGEGEWVPKANQYTVDDYVPEGWSDTAIATDDDTNKFVYASWRDKPKGSNTWGDFNNPILWSNWGVQGVDGDGVQYVYKLFNHELNAAERESNIPTKPAEMTNGEWIPTGWSDDPLAPTISMQYCYCSTIKKIGGSWASTFDTLGLWSRFSKDGQGAFKSTVFCRSNTTPNTPLNTTPTGTTYNTYSNPIPPVGSDNITWTDGIPVGDAQIWASSRIFTNDGQSPQESVWKTPQPMSDTTTYDVEFAKKQTGDATPAMPTANNRHKDTDPYGYVGQVWFDPTLDKYSASGVARDFTQMYWRAERECKNGAWGSWTIIRIKGEKGDQGDGVAEYIQTQEAWSSVESVANITTEPTPNGGWSDTTPANPNNYAYLWRRSRKMVLQSDGTYAAATGSDGQWKYARLSGTNGTSISVKGTVATVADLSNITNPQDGDAYVVSANGHLYMWSSEANDWIDLGVFKGDPGTTYYTHIAWASAVTIGTTPSGHTTTGQTTTPNATSVTDFHTAPFTGAAWMGVLINTLSGDDSPDSLSYTWNKVEGPQGPAGGRTATVYLYKRSATAPASVGIDAGTLIDGVRYLYYKFATKTLYTDASCTTEFTSATTGSNGWSLNIPEGDNPIYVTAAIAYSDTDNDDIGSNEWVTPALFTGEHGINSATVFLYKRAASQPDDTNNNYVCPQGTLHYKFDDGELYTYNELTHAYTKVNEGDAALSGWKLKIPATDGNPCWIIQAAALNSGDYDAIEVTKSGSTYTKKDWSSVRKMTEDGNGISTITRTYAISEYATSTNDSTPPADLDPYNQTDWSASSPATTAAKPYLWAREVITYTKQGVSATTRYYCVGKKGDNGIDAQDVEWVFVRTQENVAPEVPATGEYSEASQGYSSDDHLPYVRVASDKHIKGYNNSDGTTPGDGYKYVKCTDDPQGVDSTWRFEWELKRTKGSVQSNNSRTWNPYSGSMSLRNNYAESALVIDISNDNDQFGTDINGVILPDEQEHSTAISMYFGSHIQTLTNVTASLTYEDGTQISNVSPNDNDIAKVVRTFNQDNTEATVTVTIGNHATQDSHVTFPSSHSGLKVHITATCAMGTKSIDFTIQQVKSGAAGVSPTIYQLAPTLKAFSFYRDASNNLLPASQSVQVNVARTEGNTTTILSTEQTGITYDWGFDNNTTAVESGKAVGSSITLPVSDPTNHYDAITHYQIWVELSTGDRETLPIIKDGAKGSNGTSPWIADLDNEMDSIACDTDGHPVQIGGSDQSVQTTVSMWHGSQKQSSTIRVFDDTTSGAEYTSGTKKNGITVAWNNNTGVVIVTFDSGNTVTFNGNKVFCIQQTSGTEVKALFFTVNGVRPGENGQPATIYSLVPSQSQISVGRTAAGGYNPSTFTLTCGYTKNVGGVMTTVADVTGQIDNTYNIYHRKRNRSSGSWTAFYLYSQYKTDSDAIHTLANFSVANYDAVEFVLCTNTGRKIDGTTNPSEPQNIIDRETVPVVSDGENGSDGKNAIHMDIDNEYDSIQYQGDGVTKVSPSATVQTTAYLFDGVTDKSSDATFTISNRSGMTNEQATISGRVVTVSGLNSDGEVTIRAEYPASSGKYYYAKFTVKKLIGTDKYDLVVTPNAVGVNTSNTVADTAISVQVYRTPANGGTRHLVEFTKVSGAYTNSYGLTLSVIDSLSNALAETTTGSEATTRTFNLTGSMATYADNVFVTLTKDSKTQDSETIPITRVHNGIDGSGSNAVKIDLDNEMDSIPCDSDGKVTSQTVLEVNARIYDGASPVSSGVAVSSVGAIAGESAVTSISNGIVNIKWTIPATGSGTPLSVDKFTSQIVLTWGGNSYYATFTANVVKSGEPGVSPTVFQLLPSPSQISFKRDSSGVIPSSTQTLSLSIKKSDGNGQSVITVAESNLTVRYRTSQFPSSHTDGREWPSAGLSVSSSATYGNVYIAAFDSSGTLVDRETVAIVKDGENGIAGASNSYITVKGGCARTVDGEQEPVQVDGSVTIFDGRTTTVINVSDIETSWGTNQRRGFALVAIDRQTLEYEYYSRFYDVTDATYGSYLLGLLVDDIAVYSEGGYFVCLFSQDSVAWSNDLVEALKGLGGTGVANAATGRYPFAFIGQGGLEQGHARQNQGTLEQATAVEVTAYFADGNLITSKDGEPGEDAWVFTAEPANVIITQNMVTTTNFSSATVSFSAKKGSRNATITSIGTPTSTEFHVVKGTGDNDKRVIVDRPNTYTPTGETSAVYYTEGSFRVTVNATAPDGSTSSKEVTVLCYANLMGTFKTIIEGDVETSVAQSLEYAINGTEVNSFTNVGTYIRSSKEKTDAVAETVTTLTTANPANIFGFTKGIKFVDSTWHVLPYIQDYGFEVYDSNNNYQRGRISNIGFNGIDGLYVLTCEMKASAVSVSEKFKVELCDQKPFRVISGLDANGKYTPNASDWTKVCAVYALTREKLGQHFDNYVGGSMNGFMDVESDTAGTSTHVFIRCLQIERAAIPSSTFGICDNDDKYASQHDHEYVEDISDVALDDTAKWTANPATGGFAPSGSTWNGMAVYENAAPLTSSNGAVSGDYRIMELSASNLSVTAKTPYTLSFWAKASAAAKMRCAMSCGNTGGSVYEENSALEYNQSASTATSGMTKITLGTTWKKYYVHFYAESTVTNATAIGIRISTEDSLPSNCTFSVCGLKLEDGYITSYERTDYKTVIQQTSRTIDMSVLVNSVKKAGIELTTNQAGDVTQGVIRATADQFEWQNTNGDTILGLDGSGNATFSGNLNAAGGTFTGTLSGVTGTFTGSLSSTNDFIQLTTSKVIGNVDWRGLAVMGREEGVAYSGDLATFGARIGNDVSCGRIALAKRVITRSGSTVTVTTTIPITLDADDGSIEATKIEVDNAKVNSELELAGVVTGLKLQVIIKDSGNSYTPSLQDGIIIIKSNQNFNISLPQPDGDYIGKFYLIRNRSGNTLTVSCSNGSKIVQGNNGEEVLSKDITRPTTMCFSDGSNWILLYSDY